jgi:hypothetical protein
MAGELGKLKKSEKIPHDEVQIILASFPGSLDPSGLKYMKQAEETLRFICDATIYICA